MSKFYKLFILINITLKRWLKANPFQYGGALAFYILLSLGPALLIITSTTGYIIGEKTVKKVILSKAQKYIGIKGAKLIQSVIRNSKTDTSGPLSTFISFLVIILGATAVFSQIQYALNQIWESPPKQGKSIFIFFKGRAKSLLMIFCIAIIILISFIMNTGLLIISILLKNIVPPNLNLLKLASFSISFFVITLLFAAIYKLLPDIKISWSDVWIGSAITSALFLIGQYLISIYLSYSNVVSFYGAAGSLALFMLWIFYSSVIFFIGAEFTHVYANRKTFYKDFISS